MKEFDVVGLGNAIVDVIAKVDDNFIQKQELVKGSMTLINEEQAEAIYSSMPSGTEKSGGSAANTLAGLSSLGARAAFIGKVKNDTLGKIFTHDIRAIGVSYNTKQSENGPSTARCLVSVTPDAERTMATYLGAATEITEDDIDEEVIKNSRVLYLEGYLWYEAHAKQAMRKAMHYAKKHGTKIALSLSDSFCVINHRSEFNDLIKSQVDILFANEDEIKELFEVRELKESIKNLLKHIELVAITRGYKGSWVIKNGHLENIESGKNLVVVDTTGAGDLYAAGFLYGYVNNISPRQCGEIATIAASEVIQHIGARPEIKLSKLVNLENFEDYDEHGHDHHNCCGGH